MNPTSCTLDNRKVEVLPKGQWCGTQFDWKKLTDGHQVEQCLATAVNAGRDQENRPIIHACYVDQDLKCRANPEDRLCINGPAACVLDTTQVPAFLNNVGKLL